MAGVSLPTPLPIYLGPTLPRWHPLSTADVQTAITDGTMTERHWLDVKEQLGNGDKVNKELARDLASFANDGGVLIVGVAEVKETGRLSLAPVELAGLAERVEQIALARCDPPLFVVCHPLAEPDNPTRGLLVIEVPASPSAPHMVDGEYHGRGDKTKHRLTDSAVANLHARRTVRQLTGEQLIAREVARSPIRLADQRHTHLFVVAQPLAGPPDLLTSLIDRLDNLVPLIRGAQAAVPRLGTISPNLNDASKREPRPKGAGLFSDGIVGRRFQSEMQSANERSQLDLEVHDDGGVVLFCGGASVDGRRALDGSIPQHVHEGVVVGLTRVTVGIAGALGGRTGYAGRWLIAVGLTQLSGRFSDAAISSMGPIDYPAYSEDGYVQATEAVTVELLSQPGAITSRLLSRLLRALRSPVGTYGHWLADQPATE
jgi:hypothetical protein